MPACTEHKKVDDDKSANCPVQEVGGDILFSQQDGISETITARQEGPGAFCRGAMGRRAKEKN